MNNERPKAVEVKPVRDDVILIQQEKHCQSGIRRGFPSEESHASAEPLLPGPINCPSEMGAVSGIDGNRSINVILKETSAEGDAKEKVRKILDDYIKSGKPHKDNEFPHHPKSLVREPIGFDHKSTKWKRLSEQPGNWKVFNNPLSTDICQGDLRNCWFLSALAVVATHPESLEKIILTKEFQMAGVYLIKLCRSGQWECVIIDEFVPFNENPEKPLYCYTNRQQLWGSLIEKAAAKLYGCYENLTQGRCLEALSLLTGQPCEYFRCKGKGFDCVWEKLEKYIENERFLICASCISNKYGLVENHAYSVLQVLNIPHMNIRLVQLRNPWGKQSWSGPWCDGSEVWTTLDEDTRRKCDSTNCKEGIFWMDVTDFCKHFESLDICKTRPGQFEKRFSGTYPHGANEHWKQYHLTVNQKTVYDIGLFQKNKRHEARTNENLNDHLLLVLKYKHDPFEVEKICAHSSYWSRTFVGLEAELEQGEYIIACVSLKNYKKADKRGTHGASYASIDTETMYTLTLHSPSKISAVSLNKNLYHPHAVTDALILLTIKGKGCKEECAKDVKLYKYFDDCIIYVVENDSDHWCKFTLDVQAAHALYTRNEEKTVDYIPSYHRQIIQVVIPMCTTSFQFNNVTAKCEPVCMSEEDMLTSGIQLHTPEIFSGKDDADDIHEPRFLIKRQC